MEEKTPLTPLGDAYESIERAIGNTRFWLDSNPSREGSLVLTKLQEAQHWLDEFIGEDVKE